jgi:hypothetical protein
MYQKDHLLMASVYQKQIINESTMPIAIVQTQSSEDSTSRDYEQEAMDMAVGELETLLHGAEHVLDCIKNGMPIEPWMASKITLASDYISSVTQVLLKHKQDAIEDEEEEEETGGDFPFQADTCRGTGDGTMA